MPHRRARGGLPTRVCSTSGSRVFQGAPSGSTSPLYHMPQEPEEYNNHTHRYQYHPYSYASSFRRPSEHHPHRPSVHSYCEPQLRANEAHSSSSKPYLRDRTCSDGSLSSKFFTDGNRSSEADEKRLSRNYDQPHQYPRATLDSRRSYRAARAEVSRQGSSRQPRSERRVFSAQPAVPPMAHAFVEPNFIHNSLSRQAIGSALSEYSHSANSSVVGPPIVGGCGGHCVAFENFCYYVLQIIFVIGILTGISLCIAGTVLRRTKSRDLQVLIYIGALSSMVCALLLGVQYQVRRDARRRKKTLCAARSIPLNDVRPIHQLSPLIVTPVESVRLTDAITHSFPPNLYDGETDTNGVPWWRRKDSN